MQRRCGEPDHEELDTLLEESREEPLLARPTAGGEERTILPCVFGFAVATRARSILYGRTQATSDLMMIANFR